MRWSWGVLALAGCESDVCALLGEYSGTFEGDAQGAVQLAVVEDEANPDTPTAGMTLLSDDGYLSADGIGTATCSTGELVIDLRDLNGDTIGDAAGTLADGGGSGEWGLITGDGGTWSLN